MSDPCHTRDASYATYYAVFELPFIDPMNGENVEISIQSCDLRMNTGLST